MHSLLRLTSVKWQVWSYGSARREQQIQKQTEPLKWHPSLSRQNVIFFLIGGVRVHPGVGRGSGWSLRGGGGAVMGTGQMFTWETGSEEPHRQQASQPAGRERERTTVAAAAALCIPILTSAPEVLARHSYHSTGDWEIMLQFIVHSITDWNSYLFVLYLLGNYGPVLPTA